MSQTILWTQEQSILSEATHHGPQGHRSPWGRWGHSQGGGSHPGDPHPHPVPNLGASSSPSLQQCDPETQTKLNVKWKNHINLMSWQIKANYICLFLNHQTQSVAFIIDFKQPLFFNCGKHSSKQQRKYEPYKSNGHVLFIYFYQGFPIILPHPLFKFHEISPKKPLANPNLLIFTCQYPFPSVPRSPFSRTPPLTADTRSNWRHNRNQ